MPIVERDPWRKQYFRTSGCPRQLRIPTEDSDAWQWYPAHRWVYDKLQICHTQGLPAAPHGVQPPSYPVFSKPIFNLQGMGLGSRVIHSEAEYRTAHTPGHFWMPRLRGKHISTDVAVLNGQAMWWRHAYGAAGPGGTFDHWVVEAQQRPALEKYLGTWIATHLPDYCGMLNVESIGGRIIEAHLRFADQWVDLYGPGWVQAVVRLYGQARWQFTEQDRRPGYSVVLFGPHGRQYRKPPSSLQRQLLTQPSISSLQITFHDDRPPEQHAMPPGGFRLAIVNCWNLQAGRDARRQLAEWFEV